MTSAELLKNFDDNATLTLARLGATDEHAAQIMCLEVLRILNAHWNTTSYNAMSDCTWMNVVGDGCHRAAMHPAAMMHALTWGDMVSAANQGGAYFEQGYQATIDATSTGDRISMTRQGGVQ